jgi:hypothetical protein
MGIALQPTGSWIELVVTSGSPDPTLRLAPRPWADPPTYYGGKKRGTVLRFGDVIRSLSDRSGSPSVASFSVEVFDRDGSLRDLLESVVYLTGADLTFYLASAQAHDLAYLPDPRVGFRGQLITPAPRAGRVFTLACESRMGTRYGPFDYETPVLKRKFETTDFPNLPRENVGKAVPFAWGEFSDEGTVSQVPGPTAATGGSISPLDVARGMVIPIATGYLPGGTPGGPTLGMPPTNFQVSITGTGATKPVQLAVTFRNANGQTTAAYLNISNYPAHPGPFPGTPTFYADWTWDDPNPAGTFSSGIAYLDDFDGTGWHILDGAYLTYTDDGDDSHDKGPGGQTPPAVNTAVIGNSSTQKRFYCLSANPGRIISIYHSDGGNPPAYTPMTAGEIGTYFDLGPTDEGYVYTAASGREYFGFLAQGPFADAHDNGTMPFRVNFCGWHDEATPLELIDELALIYQDVIVQLQGNNGDGWQGGARLTIPYYASSPTVPILQSSTFAVAQAVTVTELGTSGSSLGALGAVYLDSFDITWRTFTENMNRTGQFDSGENHHGQFAIHAIPLAVNPVTGTMLREYIDIRRVVDAGEPHPDEIEDSINYQYDWCPADQQFRSGLIPNALTPGYGVKRERPGTLDLIYTRDPATATWSSNKYLTLRAIAPRYPALICKFRKALAIELGDQFRVQHTDLGEGTFVLYCLDQRASVSRGEVELRGRLRLIA